MFQLRLPCVPARRAFALQPHSIGFKLQHSPSLDLHTAQARTHTGVAAKKVSAPEPDEVEPDDDAREPSFSQKGPRTENPEVVMNEVAAQLLLDYHGLGETPEEVLASLRRRGVAYSGTNRARRFTVPLTPEDIEHMRQQGVQEYALTVKTRTFLGCNELARALRLTARKGARPSAKKTVPASGNTQELHLRWAAEQLSRKGYVWEVRSGANLSTPEEFYTKLVQVGVKFVDVRRNQHRFKVPDIMKLGMVASLPELAQILEISLLNEPTVRTGCTFPSRMPPSLQQVEELSPADAAAGMHFLAEDLLKLNLVPEDVPHSTNSALAWLASSRVVCVGVKRTETRACYRSYAILPEGVKPPLTMASLRTMPVLPKTYVGTSRLARALGLKT